MALLAPRGPAAGSADLAGSDLGDEADVPSAELLEPGPSRPGGRRAPSIAASVVAGCAYVVLALLAYWPVQPFSTTKVVSCGCYDPVEQMWFLAWTPHAILHGLNPFYTHALNVPAGANLAANTTMPLLGVLASPITLTLGPVAAYNVLIRLALCSSALSMCLVLRHYRLRWPVAFLGGLVYGFSPYMFAQGSLHLNLAFVPLLPLIVVAIDDLVVRDRHSARRAGLTLGALATAQYYVSSELLADLGVVAVAGVIVLALRFPRRAAARARRVAAGAGWALVPFVLLAGYPILFGLYGPEHYVKNWEVWHGDETIQNDLLSPLVPTPGELIAPSRWASLGAGLVGGVSENGGYLGIPLVACWLAASVWAAFKRSSLALLFAVLVPIAFLLSLGPALQVHGRATGIWLPFAVSSHLPLLQLVVPARYSVLVSICVVVTCAVALDALWSRLATRPAAVAGAGSTGAEPAGAEPAGAGAGPASAAPRPARRLDWLTGPTRLPEILAATALVVVALLPLLPARAIASAPVDDPSYFSSQAVRAVPPGSSALVYPYPIEQDDFSMLWQATSGFRFNLLGGYILTPLTFNSGGDVPVVLPPATVQVILYAANGSSSWAKSSTLEQVFGSTTPDHLHPARFATVQVKEFLDMYHVSTVIEDPASWPGPAAPGSPVAAEPSYQPDYYPQAITAL
ncbi:MAG TPA: hypothetical protein VMD59_07565, partial [Acidimicrobiales bacterium]|nr:hypothetical protein [Acidimicrobiales bacterium]